MARMQENVAELLTVLRAVRFSAGGDRVRGSESGKRGEAIRVADGGGQGRRVRRRVQQGIPHRPAGIAARLQFRVISAFRVDKGAG